MFQDRFQSVRMLAFAGLLLLGLGMSVILTGCSLLQPSPPATLAPDLIYTAAAQTVVARLTEASGGSIETLPTATSTAVSPTQTATILPSDTAVPTSPPATDTPLPPTATSQPPTATAIPIPCDRASFVADITYPDGTDVAVGTTFVKTWRLVNNGSCTWTSGYSVVFSSGDAMSGPAAAQFTTGTVPPGAKVDISVTLKAPDSIGTYRGYWKLRNSAGALFGIGSLADKPFWVQIDAVEPVTVAYDFIKQGPNAAWQNGSKPLAWGDPADDTSGVAAEAVNRILDDGKTYPRLLATFPEKITDGLIRGVYPAYKVKSGDHFRAVLGLKNGCDVGKVRYILSYLVGGAETVRGEWVETCDDKVTTVDINLNALVGQTVQFVLTVETEGSYSQDNSYWVAPRIER